MENKKTNKILGIIFLIFSIVACVTVTMMVFFPSSFTRDIPRDPEQISVKVGLTGGLIFIFGIYCIPYPLLGLTKSGKMIKGELTKGWTYAMYFIGVINIGISLVLLALI